MNGPEFMNGGTVYLEIGQGSLRILKGEAGLELPLERQENGRLTDACKLRVTAAVQGFLKRAAWQPRLRALCAINARGVSLRQMTLPVASGEELRRLLRLQIESEFPLGPDELAWGYRPLDAKSPEGAGKQVLLIAAVKKEVLEQYAELLGACGLSPVFTLAALARGFLCSPLQGSYAMLDVGRTQAELTLYENNAATSVRVLPWGGENLSGPGAAGLLDPLITSLKNNQGGRKLYLTGEGVRERGPAQRLADELSAVADCERIDLPTGEGRSPAILGLKKAVEKDGGQSLLTMEVKEAKTAGRGMRPMMTKWAIRAAALLLAVLAFPYLEALVMKPRLEKKITELENSRGRLAMIDRELSFLQYLKTNEPPYLDAVFLLASDAAQGTRIENISMNRRGEVAFRGTMQNSQQVVDFRSKLISSGFYSNVVVEEQTPSPDRQHVTVRMSAQWKPEAAREGLVLGPPKEDFEKLRAAAKEAKFAQAPPMMGNPFPMMSAPPPMAMPTAGPSKPAVTRSPNASRGRIVLPPGVTLPPGFSLPDDNK